MYVASIVSWMVVILTFSLYSMIWHWYATQFGLARVSSDYRVSVHVVGAPLPPFVLRAVGQSGVGDLNYWFRLLTNYSHYCLYGNSHFARHFQRGQRSEPDASQGVVRIQCLS